MVQKRTDAPPIAGTQHQAEGLEDLYTYAVACVCVFFSRNLVNILINSFLLPTEALAVIRHLAYEVLFSNKYTLISEIHTRGTFESQ